MGVMTYVIQAIESIKGALKWTKLYFLIYVRPVVEWLNTAVSKTADPGFESHTRHYGCTSVKMVQPTSGLNEGVLLESFI